MKHTYYIYELYLVALKNHIANKYTCAQSNAFHSRDGMYAINYKKAVISSKLILNLTEQKDLYKDRVLALNASNKNLCDEIDELNYTNKLLREFIDKELSRVGTNFLVKDDEC